MIIISTLSASASVGLPAYVNQEAVSGITCSISMIVTVLTSIKLYLNLEDLIKNEHEMSKQFNLLSLDVYKVLHLKQEQRDTIAVDYLDKTFLTYITLIEKSNLLRKRLKCDELIDIETNKYFSDIESQSSSKGVEI